MGTGNKMNFIKKLLQKWFSDQPNYLYRSGWNLGTEGNTYGSEVVEFVSGGSYGKKKEDLRIEKKPIEVWDEIISQVPKIDLNSLDKKIMLVKQRKDIIEKMIRKDSATDEIEALGFLEARKRYLKTKDLFQWSATTFDLVERLLKKYKLKMIDLQTTTGHKIIPMEGLIEIKKFVSAFNKVRKDEPVLKIILEDDSAKSPEAKKKSRRADPIILAGSPFGKWFYILGAWDKEVEYIEDLIYKNK